MAKQTEGRRMDGLRDYFAHSKYTVSPEKAIANIKYYKRQLEKSIKDWHILLRSYFVTFFCK